VKGFIERLKRRDKTAIAISCVAMFLALGGTALAGKLITGKQIKDSSVTGKDVKDGSLTAKDIKGSIAGPQGPQGPAGTAAATNATIRSQTVSFAPGSRTLTVPCNAGETATGGGLSITAGGTYLGSYPSPFTGKPTGWTGSLEAAAGSGTTASVYVVCVSP